MKYNSLIYLLLSNSICNDYCCMMYYVKFDKKITFYLVLLILRSSLNLPVNLRIVHVSEQGSSIIKFKMCNIPGISQIYNTHWLFGYALLTRAKTMQGCPAGKLITQN